MKFQSIRALALALPLAFVATHAQPQRELLSTVPIRQLEDTYLRCAEVATNSVMDSGDAVRCSMVADALRDRAFGGSFERLLAWWHATRRVASERPMHDILRPTSEPLH